MDLTKINQKIPQQVSKPHVPKYVQEFAKNMEKQFLEHMLEKISKSEKKDDSANSYYKSLLRQERADMMANLNNGIGIQDMIIKDYLKKYSPQPINQYQNQQKGVGHE